MSSFGNIMHRYILENRFFKRANCIEISRRKATASLRQVSRVTRNSEQFQVQWFLLFAREIVPADVTSVNSPLHGASNCSASNDGSILDKVLHSDASVNQGDRATLLFFPLPIGSSFKPFRINITFYHEQTISKNIFHMDRNIPSNVLRLCRQKIIR